jgi:Fe2+ or Zn2+ uptake regulation protein
VRSPAELTDLFRARGLKVTPQRLSVFRAVHDDREHPTAQAVHARVVRELPTVSLRTVYATLHDLAAMGEVGLLELGTGSVRVDPNVGPHHHLVCECCGRVQDVEAPAGSVRLPADLDHGFEVTGTQIVFRGRCSQCRTGEDVQDPGLAPVDERSGPGPGRPDRRAPIGSTPSRGDVPTYG